MKKKLLIPIITILILGIILLIVLFDRSNKEKFIKGNEELYDLATQHIIDNYDSPDKDKKMYKTFVETEKFGITEDKEYRYAYLWILSQGYYLKDKEIVKSTESSMPYKFTYTKDNKLVDYETPEDGKRYAESIKEMYPNSIEDKVLEYKPNTKNLDKQVKEFYKNKIK